VRKALPDLWSEHSLAVLEEWERLLDLQNCDPNAELHPRLALVTLIDFSYSKIGGTVANF
jgi:hypothetical protein